MNRLIGMQEYNGWKTPTGQVLIDEARDVVSVIFSGVPAKWDVSTLEKAGFKRDEWNWKYTARICTESIEAAKLMGVVKP